MKLLGGLNTMNNRDVCWYCGGQLCWDADFDAEDFGYEEEGIVTRLHCNDCGAVVTYELIQEPSEYIQ